MSEKNTGMVTFELDPLRDERFTAEEQNQLKTLREMRDSEIDLSDIPAAREGGGWIRSGRALLAESAVPLANDLRGFFDRDGRPDTALINSILRDYMHSHPEHS